MRFLRQAESTRPMWSRNSSLGWSDGLPPANANPSPRTRPEERVLPIVGMSSGSDHDWLEGRGEKLYRIVRIDDASRLLALFVRYDSAAENMHCCGRILEKNGRRLAFSTDKASLFRKAEKRKRDEPGWNHGRWENWGSCGLPRTPPRPKGGERNFETAQGRLVKGMRVAGVKTRTPTVAPARDEDAHRLLRFEGQ